MTKFLIFSLVAFFLSGCSSMDQQFTRKTVLEHEDVSKISLAIESDNLEALKAIIGKLPSDKNQRSFADNNLVNQATIKVASNAEKCNKDMVEYLLSIGGDVYFNSGIDVDKNSYMRAFCGSYLLNYVNMTNPKYAASVAAGNSTNAYNNFIAFINGEFNTKDTDILIARLQKYKDIIFAAYDKAHSFCTTEPASEACLSSGIYKKLSDNLTEKVSTENATKKFKEFWIGYLKELKAKF